MTANRRRKASIRNRATQTGASFSAASNNSHRGATPSASKPLIIDNIIGRDVALMPSGPRGRLSGKCPFHDDDHRSLSVDPGAGLFHCFGCGATGGAVDYIQKRDGVSFSEAAHRAEALSDSHGPAPRRYLPVAPRLDLRTAYLAAEPLMRSTPVDALWFVRIEQHPEHQYDLTTPALPDMDRYLAQAISRVQQQIAATHPVLEGAPAVRLVDITRSAAGTARADLAPSIEQRRANVAASLRYASQYPITGSEYAEDAERALTIIRDWLEGDTETTPEERVAISRRTQSRSAAAGVPGAAEHAAHAAGTALAAIDAPLDGRNLTLATMIHSGRALAAHLTDPTAMWLDRLDDYITHDAATYGLQLATIPVDPTGREIARRAAEEHLTTREAAEQYDRETSRPAILERYAPPTKTHPDTTALDLPSDDAPTLVLSLRGWENGYRVDAHEFAAIEVGLGLGKAMTTANSWLVTALDQVAAAVMDEREEVTGDTAETLVSLARLTLNTLPTDEAAERHAQAIAASRMARLAVTEDGATLTRKRGLRLLASTAHSTPDDVLAAARLCLALGEDNVDHADFAVGYALLAVGNDLANGQHRELAKRPGAAAVDAFAHAASLLALNGSEEQHRRTWLTAGDRFIRTWRSVTRATEETETTPAQHARAIVEAEAIWWETVANTGVTHAGWAERHAAELRATLA